MRCLIVEDEPNIQAELAYALAAAGFTTRIEGDGEAAWRAGDTQEVDIAILDLGLPRLDGLSALRRWRAAGRSFPVLILSARNDWMEKVEGIEAGADDYMAKPFEMGELVARLRGLLRRQSGRVSNVVRMGRVQLDTLKMSATFKGTPAQLSPLEFRLLNCMAHKPGRTVSATALAEHLYGTTPQSSDINAVEAIVARLRRKFGADIIVTRRGFGYLIESAA